MNITIAIASPKELLYQEATMSYIKAETVLPQNIIEIIQQYIDGENIYIPKKTSNRTGWGEKSGAKKELFKRDSLIYRAYLDGTRADVLAEQFFLSEKSIRRIIRKMKISEPV